MNSNLQTYFASPHFHCGLKEQGAEYRTAFRLLTSMSNYRMKAERVALQPSYPTQAPERVFNELQHGGTKMTTAAAELERRLPPWRQKEVVQNSRESSISSKSSMEDNRRASGVLLLSTNGRLLYTNRQGAEYLSQINGTSVGDGHLPPTVTEMCAQIEKLLSANLASKEWEQLEIRRIAGRTPNPILVRGFGLPGGSKTHCFRVLIILEPIGRCEGITEQTEDRFQLTVREKAVVQHLLKGYTNKEIGSALGITEPTVKAHIKHIMEKTQCTTRTGILAQILQA